MLLSVKPVSSLIQHAKGRSMSLNAAITKLLKTAPLEKMGLVAFMLFVQLANRLQDEGALDELELAKMLKDASQGNSPPVASLACDFFGLADNSAPSLAIVDVRCASAPTSACRISVLPDPGPATTSSQSGSPLS